MVLFLVSALVIGTLMQVIKTQQDELMYARIEVEIVKQYSADVRAASEILMQDNKMLNDALMQTPSRDIRTY